MKHDIVPAWMWRDPALIIDDLLALSASNDRRAMLSVSRETKCGATPKDRYYTMARKAHIRALPKERG